MDLPSVVSNAKSSQKDTKDEERLRSGLEFDIIFNRVRKKESCLEVYLWKDQTQKYSSIGGFSNGIQVGSYTQLCDGNRSGTNVFGGISTKCYGKRLKSHCTISLDTLEIIDNGNS